MTKIWIIYNTKYGNCGIWCEEVESRLKEKYDVKKNSVKEITPNDVANDPPDVLLVGARIVVMSPDKKVKGFVKKLGGLLKQPIPKAAILYTHGSPWDDAFNKMGKILEENDVANDILPEILEIKMAKTKGPAESDQGYKVDKFIDNLTYFIER
ncbi:MAG: hypothetical protein ACFE9T_13940 [Promethearchaeota archaeon]